MDNHTTRKIVTAVGNFGKCSHLVLAYMLQTHFETLKNRNPTVHYHVHERYSETLVGQTAYFSTVEVVCKLNRALYPCLAQQARGDKLQRCKQWKNPFILLCPSLCILFPTPVTLALLPIHSLSLHLISSFSGGLWLDEVGVGFFPSSSFSKTQLMSKFSIQKPSSRHLCMVYWRRCETPESRHQTLLF